MKTKLTSLCLVLFLLVTLNLNAQVHSEIPNLFRDNSNTYSIEDKSMMNEIKTKKDKFAKPDEVFKDITWQFSYRGELKIESGVTYDPGYNNELYNIGVVREIKENKIRNFLMIMNHGYSKTGASGEFKAPYFGDGELAMICNNENIFLKVKELNGPNTQYYQFEPSAANNWVGYRRWEFNAIYYYELTAEELNKICNSEKISLQISNKAKGRIVEANVKSGTLKDFKKYYQKYVQAS